MSGHWVMESKKGNFLKRKLKKMGRIKSSSRLRRLVGKIAQMEKISSPI